MSTQENEVLETPTTVQETVVSFDKYTKTQLIEYINTIIPQFNELNNNYSVLYNEYQKLISAPTEAPVQNIEIKEFEIKIQELETKLKESNELVESHAKMFNTLKDSFDNITKEKDSLIAEKAILTEEINNLTLEKAKGQKSTSLKSVNDRVDILEKNTFTSGAINIYEIKAHENRVDNSEFYQGREFTIAKVLVKLQDTTFTWTVDFLGSELFKPEKFTRTITMNQEQTEYFNGLLKNNSLFNSMKAMLDIPAKFDANIWFNSILCIMGDEIKEPITIG